MNKYQITINGMHCTGCKNLIQMSLEDEVLSNITVDFENHQATFTSTDDEQAVKNKLDKVFEELKDYTYLQLIKLNENV